VVLVPVGQNERFDVVQAVPDVVEVGQDEVNPGLIIVREQHTAVDDEQASLMLKNGHIPADLAKASQGDNA
jgi:hypothetical protein